jgi:hypothetical protein
VAAALVVSGQPASAADRGPAGKPAPTDPRAAGPGKAKAQGRPRHTVPNPLLKEKLAEEADERGTEAPAPSALCQMFINKPNPYRRPAPNVDVIGSGDSIVPVGSQAGCSSAQNETTMAVNPANPRNLVAGANDYRLFNTREQRNDASGFAYTTVDGGRTWMPVQLPHLTFQTGAVGPLHIMDLAGDPTLSFGNRNTVYYANLVFSRAAVPAGDQGANGLVVSVSHDGGQTFDEPSIVQLDGVAADGTHTPTTVFNDKEWIAADPNTDDVYVTWTRFTYDAQGRYLESPIMVKKSTDRGRSWGPATRVAPTLDGFTGGITPYDHGSLPQVGRDHALYVAYEASVCATAACDQLADHDAVVVATSRDGGRTFTNTEVATDFEFPDTLTGENFRINSYPQMAYDAASDRLWITWADDRNGRYDPATGASVQTNGDVFVVGSGRGGRDWSQPLRVGTGADEWFPAVAARHGRVAVSYHTRAYDPDGVGVDYAYSVGWAEGIGGAPVRRLTTETSDPRIQFVGSDPDDPNQILQGVFIGDYTSIAMGDDFVVHPCWTDFRGNPAITKPNQDVYTQAVRAF